MIIAMKAKFNLCFSPQWFYWPIVIANCRLRSELNLLNVNRLPEERFYVYPVYLIRSSSEYNKEAVVAQVFVCLRLAASS